MMIQLCMTLAMSVTNKSIEDTTDNLYIGHDAVFRQLRHVHNLSIGSYKLFVFGCTHLANCDKLEHEDKHAQMYTQRLCKYHYS